MEGNVKKASGKRKSFTTFLLVLLLLSFLINGSNVIIPITRIASAVDISSYIDTNTSLSVVSGLNQPPNTPSNPSPSNGATDVDIDSNLSWTGGDPDSGDTVTYDVYFGTSSSPPKVSGNQSGTAYDPGTMSYETKYYWKIVAWDNHGNSSSGAIWSFTTEEAISPPPPILDEDPRINWYDLQNASGSSKLNSQIDVNQEYKFCINISSDQGWDDINSINITAWYDNGSETTTYNDSKNLGGNLNMFLRYKNTAGNGDYAILWPDDEVTKGNFTKTSVTDPDGTPDSTECYNLSFSFIPGYQLRYAPGDESWDSTKNAINDVWSWNFKILVTDDESNTASKTDEFGISSYSEVGYVGMPTMNGEPGEKATADSNITLYSRSNADYSLSVDVDNFLHEDHPTANFSNQTIWVRGGDLNESTKFSGDGPIYLYGSSYTYANADDNNSTKTTNNVEYKCDIPYGQLSGDYYATIYYNLKILT